MWSGTGDTRHTALRTCLASIAIMARELATQLEEIDLNSSSAADSLRSLLTSGSSSDADTVKVKEAALGRLCDLLVKQGDAESLGSLFQELRPMFATIPKAKTAKIVRTVIDAISRVPGSTELLVSRYAGSCVWSLVAEEGGAGAVCGERVLGSCGAVGVWERALLDGDRAPPSPAFFRPQTNNVSSVRRAVASDAGSGAVGGCRKALLPAATPGDSVRRRCCLVH